ncbi:MAG TPA: FAD-linked oxidase C-terminal domain-containing protein [Candidatus Polarisedimenticolia bacterium]|nr:FAD-linked oxidase C-terminal domain-containing protein [Candidatus Polarisedimenticolia bacterium]
MRPYGRVTHAILEELAGIVGRAHATADPETLALYSRDETEDLSFPPEAVVRPETTEQVSRVMKIATRERIPVTPRGAGTGLSGGALPVFGGISLSLERMNRILEIDTDNLMAVVEPGVITEVLQTEVEKQGLYYPPDPASRGSCMIGGNVAENAGGPRAVKYGVTKDWVCGVEAVLPDGSILATGGKLRKDVSGYNLTQTLVGSEGTLAIVTKVILRLMPLPAHRRAMLACFDDVEAAARAVVAVFARGVTPSAAEFMEGEAWRTGADRVGKRLIAPDHAAYLLLEVDGRDADQVERDAATVGEACLELGAADVFVADTPARAKDVWSVRRAIGEAVKKIAPYKEEDTVVPRRQVPDLVLAVRDIIGRHGLRAICYGHAGDGNIHVNILKDEGGFAWEASLDTAIREIFEKVAALGGRISGEHGIGWVQRAYMPIVHQAVELGLMRRIKRAFDPDGILNPGKILPDEP